MTFEHNVDLTSLNTFGIHAHASSFATARTTGDVQALVTNGEFQREKTLILGGGSNVLFLNDVAGLVIKIAITGKEVIGQTDDHVWVRAGAGENWHQFVLFCVEKNWGGVENLSLIPGTVGAAPMQNIGAYGVEMKDVTESVEAVEIATGAIKTFSNDACRFGYRDSIFKQEAKDKFIITSVTFRLTTRHHRLNSSYGAVSDTLAQLGYTQPSVKAISDAVIHIRSSKLPDPAVIGNAGSFFKNPSIPAAAYANLREKYPTIPSFPGEQGMIKVPAAWLIEQCGWKGKKFGSIGVHQHQALVLVNYGGGKGDALWKLAMDIQQSVEEKFGITLQPEVNVIR